MPKSSGFLASLATKCQENYGTNCDQLTIVFPNKRAGVYFAQELSKVYNQPIWSPQIFSLEEYVLAQQSKTVLDDLQLNLILYSVYTRLNEYAESFDSFFSWGEMILKDFNDIDNYLVDPSHIFRIVQSQKELEESFSFMSDHDKKVIQQFWKGFLPTPNKKQQEFIKTWQVLKPLYESFIKELDQRSAIYKGIAFREFANSNYSRKDVWFAGFNALTKAEEKIIKTHLLEPTCDIFWDIDEYYLNSKVQEAGVFFQQYANDPILQKSIHRDAVNKITKRDTSVKVIAAPFGMGQVMSATQSITEKYNLGQLKNTLVVVTDDSLLPSLIEYFPPMDAKVNVTAGWSLDRSRVCLLFGQLLNLVSEASQKKYLHIDSINEILQYADLLEVDGEVVDDFQAKVLKENLFYHSIDAVKKIIPKSESVIQSDIDVQSLLDSMIVMLKDMSVDDLNELDKSARQLLHKMLKHISMALSESNVKFEMASFIKLFKKLGATIKIPLIGDTQRDIQVMGVLETRNLSFENVIVIGMNEGAWPSDSSNSSFIPYNIRKAFDLPVVENNDAMQSYLFYRLLQDANKIEFYYNNISEFNHNGELSRYVKQIQHESGLKISEELVVNKVDVKRPKEITVVKDDEVMSELMKYTIEEGYKKLSPSALSTYLECPMRFCFKYVKNLFEPDEIKEDVDPALLGNLLHHAMEYLYKGKDLIESKDLESLDIEGALRESFLSNRLSLDDESKVLGRQQVVYEVLKKFMEQIIKHDQQYSPFTIVGLERTDWEIELKLNLTGGHHVGLKGIIDRVDEYQGRIRILDYKSGKDSREFYGLDSLFDPKDDKRNKAVFQLFYYALLYSENNDTSIAIQPGLFNSSDLFKKDFSVEILDRSTKKVVFDARDYLDEYKEGLISLLSEIFDPSVDFVQTDDEKKCSYCPYAALCFKE
ncbi:PD-(D/E)XK nuclease family protein [Reichenbachiella versicolor]|uniref:PD-(D/E)XK nuclease family protein n=1 Tax=Reichenbachiella versicolor TaxID=1821036 RepID=UPI000D6DCECA|nr:PD-(D/E)XK nuclease family protein [Reichenbachiella versicolor]